MAAFAIFLACSTALIGCVIWTALWSPASGADPDALLTAVSPPMLLCMAPAVVAVLAAGWLSDESPHATRAALTVALLLVLLALVWPPMHIYAGWSLHR